MQDVGGNNEGLIAISREFDYGFSTTYNWKMHTSAKSIYSLLLNIDDKVIVLIEHAGIYQSNTVDHHSNYIIEITGSPLPVESVDNISYESCSFHLCRLYKWPEMVYFAYFSISPPSPNALEPVRTSHAGGGHQLAPVTPWMGWPTTSTSHHAPWHVASKCPNP